MRVMRPPASIWPRASTCPARRRRLTITASTRSARCAGCSPAPPAAFSYDPYGVPLQVTTPATDFTYAGMFHNADSGLDLTLYRAYDPIAGRWLSRDPLGEASNPVGNLYPYVEGNPVGEVDPNGLAIGDMPPAPPGWDPDTWSRVLYDDGRWALRDPSGRLYFPHAEDPGHWRHWDLPGSGDDDPPTRLPPNSLKPWPGRKRGFKKNQCPTDPNGNAPPMNDPLGFTPVPMLALPDLMPHFSPTPGMALPIPGTVLP